MIAAGTIAEAVVLQEAIDERRGQPQQFRTLDAPGRNTRGGMRSILEEIREARGKDTLHDRHSTRCEPLPAVTTGSPPSGPEVPERTFVSPSPLSGFESPGDESSLVLHESSLVNAVIAAGSFVLACSAWSAPEGGTLSLAGAATMAATVLPLLISAYFAWRVGHPRIACCLTPRWFFVRGRLKGTPDVAGLPSRWSAVPTARIERFVGAFGSVRVRLFAASGDCMSCRDVRLPLWPSGEGAFLSGVLNGALDRFDPRPAGCQRTGQYDPSAEQSSRLRAVAAVCLDGVRSSVSSSLANVRVALKQCVRFFRHHPSFLPFPLSVLWVVLETAVPLCAVALIAAIAGRGAGLLSHVIVRSPVLFGLPALVAVAGGSVLLAQLRGPRTGPRRALETLGRARLYARNVFISYSHADEAVVRRVAEAIRKAGLEPWFDRWEVEPDHDWMVRARSGIASSTHLILVLSRASCVSRNVLDEVRWAIDAHGVHFRAIVAWMDDVPIPDALAKCECIDFRDPRLDEAGLAHLLDWLKRPVESAVAVASGKMLAASSAASHDLASLPATGIDYLHFEGPVLRVYPSQAWYLLRAIAVTMAFGLFKILRVVALPLVTADSPILKVWLYRSPEMVFSLSLMAWVVAMAIQLVAPGPWLVLDSEHLRVRGRLMASTRDIKGFSSAGGKLIVSFREGVRSSRLDLRLPWPNQICQREGCLLTLNGYLLSLREQARTRTITGEELHRRQGESWLHLRPFHPWRFLKWCSWASRAAASPGPSFRAVAGRALDVARLATGALVRAWAPVLVGAGILGVACAISSAFVEALSELSSVLPSAIMTVVVFRYFLRWFLVVVGMPLIATRWLAKIVRRATSPQI